MRPLVTWLVVGALVVIGLFAARDALRTNPAPRTAATVAGQQPHPPALGGPPAIPGRTALARALRAIGAEGALYVTDATCRRFVLSLPALRWTTPAPLPGSDCGFWLRPVADDRTGIAARAVNERTIEVVSGGWTYAFLGTSPAFKPDGTLTFVRAGRLYEWTARCAPTAETIRFQGLHEVERCQKPVPGAPRSLHEVAWLSNDAYAVIAGPDGASSILAVRNGRERRLFTGVGTRVGALEASPGGRYLAARLDGTLALLRTDLPGTRALPSAGELVRAIAWSPDDRLAAVVTERYVHVFPVLRPREDVRLPVSLAFVRWR